MRKAAVCAAGLVALSLWAVTPGLADAGVGGMFVDVPTTHPAYKSIQELVKRGIIVVGAGGEFGGNSPLLRYDAAQWIHRTITNLESTIKVGTDLTPRLTSLETRVSGLDATLTRELQAIRAQLAQVQGGAEAARKAQTALVVGVTGVVLALAALALYLWF
ncbi:MAG: S-layer homology domain-containing protein [Candidatus Bipolaricaulota bacterium]|nr:S-layer homology domain-containing protein [Candidatus Bipolaricaulota bacterium]